ncbi:hypothetical protein HNV12_02650 [Methanococcoides sp. SA1]|nr:hypothetical protein [Methanococcoides sp. SA1]
MANERKSIIPKLKATKYPTIIAETYYQIIKELVTAILLVQGKKSIGENAHKDLIEEIQKSKILSTQEIEIINDLRIRRNNSYYQGKQIEKIFLDNHEKDLNQIISKLNKEISKILPQ